MKIVCFGDSLTSCGGERGRFSDILQDRFPDHTFINCGAGGETLAEGLARLPSAVLAERPDIVLVEFGANDWWQAERSPQVWGADLERIVCRISESGATPVILGVFGPYLDEGGERVEKTYGMDEQAVAYRREEERIAAAHGCAYVPNIQDRIIDRRCCWRDRNHPNEFGNRYVADSVEPVLEELLGCRALPVRKPVLRTTRDLWREAVSLAPARPAVVDGARRLSYGEAGDRVSRVAAGLRRVSGTDRPKVAVYLPNCLEYYLAYWATVQLGGAIVPLSTWLTAENLQGIFTNVQPDVLVVRSPRDELPFRACRVSPPKAVVVLEEPEGDLTGWTALERESGGKESTPGIEPGDVSIIMHTSGTTGTPKGAMMRHSDLLFNVMAAINAHQFCASDVHLLVNPMFHCTALYSSLPSAAYTKTPVVIASPADPAGLLETVARERVTTFLSVPSVFRQLLKVHDLPRYDVSSLRIMAYAGSPMPVRTIRGLRRHFPDVALHNFFGLTETISMTHVMDADEAEGRLDSIGRLLPFVRARVVDEQGTECAPGTAGELLFARENVISGYFGEPGRLEESIVTLADGAWFRTGDLATVDEEGYFFLKGRRKDMIIVAGENVYAAEVEGVLLSHEGIVEAAVKGVPATGAASFLGEEVRAYVVVARDGPAEPELRRYCYERLPSFKVPRTIVFVDKLPRNPSGKVLKGEL